LEPEEFFETIYRPLEDKIRETKRVIKKYQKEAICLWSGGKDSTVMMLLALKVNPKIPIVFVDTGVLPPETLEYVAYMRTKFKIKNLHIIKPEKDFWHLPPKIIMGHTPPKRIATHSCCQLLLMKPVLKFLKERKLKVQLLGNRWDEGERNFRGFYLHNPEPDGADTRFNMTRVFPMKWWNKEQVFEYFERYEIPLNPLYKLGYDRIACYICPATPEELLQKTHPELFELRKKAMKVHSTLYQHVERFI